MDASWIVLLVFMCLFIFPGAVKLVSMVFGIDEMEEEIKIRKEEENGKELD